MQSVSRANTAAAEEEEEESERKEEVVVEEEEMEEEREGEQGEGSDSAEEADMGRFSAGTPKAAPLIASTTGRDEGAKNEGHSKRRGSVSKSEAFSAPETEVETSSEAEKDRKQDDSEIGREEREEDAEREEKQEEEEEEEKEEEEKERSSILEDVDEAIIKQCNGDVDFSRHSLSISRHQYLTKRPTCVLSAKSTARAP